MKYYLGWQMNMTNVSQSISDALKRYMEKMGTPPKILLISDKLEEIPSNLNLIIKVHHVPKNILMIGEE